MALYRLAAETFVAGTGERVVQFVNPPTPESLKQAAHERRMAGLGAWLLAAALLLQLIALVLLQFVCPKCS